MKRASLATLFLTIFIDLLGFGIVLPLLPYYARQYGAAGITVGFVVGAYSLMQFFFSPVWGRLSDRIGRRPVLLISLAGSAVGYTVFAFADSLALLFVARIVSGIAAANIGTAQAYIADITAPEDRARGMGMIGAAFGLGFIFGPPVGGLLSSWGTTLGYHGNFLPGVAAALLSLSALTLGYFALRESKSESSVPRSRIPPQFDRRIWSFIGANRTLRAVLLTLFLMILSFAGMETTVTLHGRERFQFTARDFGWFFGLMGVVVAFVQGVMIGGLSRRTGERRLAAIGAASLALGLVLIPLIYNSSYLYAVAVLVALGQGLSFPSLNALITRVAPESERGSILGISASVASLSRIIGPPLGGVLYDAGGARGAFFTTAALVAGAFFLALSIRDQPVPLAARPANEKPPPGGS